MIDRSVFNASFSNITAISWREQTIYISTSTRCSSYWSTGNTCRVTVYNLIQKSCWTPVDAITNPRQAKQESRRTKHRFYNGVLQKYQQPDQMFSRNCITDGSIKNVIYKNTGKLCKNMSHLYYIIFLNWYILFFV